MPLDAFVNALLEDHVSEPVFDVDLVSEEFADEIEVRLKARGYLVERDPVRPRLTVRPGASIAPDLI